MKWRAVPTAPRHAIRSECGGWQISRSGRPGIDELFTLWRLSAARQRWEWVCCCERAAEAKRRAVEEQDALRAQPLDEDELAVLRACGAKAP